MQFEEFENKEKTILPQTGNVRIWRLFTLVVLVPTQRLSQIEWAVSATTALHVRLPLLIEEISEAPKRSSSKAQTKLDKPVVFSQYLDLITKKY